MELAPIISAIKDLGLPTGLAVGTFLFLLRLYVKHVKADASERMADKDKQIERLQRENDEYKSLFTKMLERLVPTDEGNNG